jgi:phosphoenolpyruvate carboxykinase (diphosphate)
MDNHPKKECESADKDINLLHYINFKLAAMGMPYFLNLESDQRCGDDESGDLSTRSFIDIAGNLIQNYNEKTRLLPEYLCAADKRINGFLKRYFDGIGEEIVNIPTGTFVLDRAGLARHMSLPPDKNEYINKYVSSHRIKQGVLHNPIHDRRTTIGTFHIVADGLPVPADKKEVPRIAFARLLKEAVNPPDELLTLPFTASQKEQAKLFTSVYMKPPVSPEVPGIIPEKKMEIRYFAPSSLISNIDFVESIFGNAGDPGLIENDSALDVDGWSGHTGCIILAPSILSCTKKGLGLPHFDDATARERKDGMCWKDDIELYNDGSPFKISCRNSDGVVITIIADNYFGYSKKEVKTQISYAANLLGLSEEEHAGGALVFPRRNLGEHYIPNVEGHSFEEIKKNFSQIMDLHSDNFGVDKNYSNIIYLPENVEVNLYNQEIKWIFKGKEKFLRLLPENTYILPDGNKIHMEKHPEAPVWRLIGTHYKGTFCHKPFTVSGGGKSEISKSLLNSIIYDTFYINNLKEDFDLVEKLFKYDYKQRWKNDEGRTRSSRDFLSFGRSLGSVIKLLNSSSHYTSEYNSFIDSIPNRIKALSLYIKGFYRPEWGGKWRSHFSVRIINGKEGNALRFEGRTITAGYLRVGFAPDNMWYVHKLRTDYIAAEKLQQEDDISVSITIDSNKLEGIKEYLKGNSIKLIKNCEFKLFQRPDEAINRGYDIEAEKDLAGKNNFISNYEPLTTENAKELIENSISFDKYTEPIQNMIKEGSKAEEGTWFISPSHPRKLPGGISTNPRYLQTRPDITDPESYYRGEIGSRFSSKIPMAKPFYLPVDAVLPSRRNNSPDKEKGIIGLSVYNPIHYQELPELFMDFICSLSGKSPSTTGAGSEGALTKGPFNMLSAVTDLNNALLSFILTGYSGFTSVAGSIGSRTRFAHDISILIPEIWSRLEPEERVPERLIEEGSLEKVEDIEWKGEKILSSRLGYRITETFLFNYMGRIFDEPHAVFNNEMLKPETQDMEAFVDGVTHIIESQKKVASIYFEDGSIESAIPPIKALFHIMVNGNYEGKDINHPEIRKLFSKEYVIKSDWYKNRLLRKQKRDIAHCKKIISYLESFMLVKENKKLTEKLKIEKRLEKCKTNLKEANSKNYLNFLEGTIGLDPVYGMDEI